MSAAAGCTFGGNETSQMITITAAITRMTHKTKCPSHSTVFCHQHTALQTFTVNIPSHNSTNIGSATVRITIAYLYIALQSYLHGNSGEGKGREGKKREGKGKEGREGGGEGGMRPWWHCAGDGIWNGENMELWNCASGELTFALQCYFYTPNTFPVLGPHPLNVSAPRPHTKQCVHYEAYTFDMSDHSPAVKL